MCTWFLDDNKPISSNKFIRSKAVLMSFKTTLQDTMVVVGVGMATQSVHTEKLPLARF